MTPPPAPMRRGTQVVKIDFPDEKTRKHYIEQGKNRRYLDKIIDQIPYPKEFGFIWKDIPTEQAAFVRYFNEIRVTKYTSVSDCSIVEDQHLVRSLRTRANSEMTEWKYLIAYDFEDQDLINAIVEQLEAEQ